MFESPKDGNKGGAMSGPLACEPKRRVFVDMDGVLVDFEGYAATHGLTPADVKSRPGAYLDMQPLPGALEAVRSIIGMGFAVWIATKPPTGIAFAYADKAAWIFERLPELRRRIIITHHKVLLGTSGDFLIDDRPHKAGCESFEGALIPFRDGMTWSAVLQILASAKQATPDVRAAADSATHAVLRARIADLQRQIASADRAVCLADCAMFERLESECIRVDDHGMAYGLVNADGAKVDTLDEAPPDLQEAINWLIERGHVELVDAPEGHQSVVVLRELV
ncbi:5' nucleotidase, deoxy (pyrimidine), cytosolic type C protein [mine drainage metagenome]|uniref:5' nucleotidase, deoxy (Pyrimidine), cytosolic type C protein n=1 Tax=mine drainage metagenome TaxID=410659 RepID=A0A1J5NYX2_9ZZZZ